MELRKALVGSICVSAFCKCGLAFWKTVAWRSRTTWATGLLPLLLLPLVLPAAVQAEDFDYSANNGAIALTRYFGSGGAVVIPATSNGLPVTSIGDAAFMYRDNPISITIPSSVTSSERWRSLPVAA